MPQFVFCWIYGPYCGNVMLDTDGSIRWSEGLLVRWELFTLLVIKIMREKGHMVVYRQQTDSF